MLHGLPRCAAYRLAGQMVAGTGRLLVESGQHPAAMKDAAVPPGTTIVGVAALERGGLRAAVIDAIDAIQKKEKEPAPVSTAGRLFFYNFIKS